MGVWNGWIVPLVRYHDDQRDWAHKCPMVEFAMNSNVSSTTGFTPFELNHGYMPRVLRTEMSWGHTKTLQGHLKQSEAANDDGWWQGSTRTWLKLWCFTTRHSLVLNLDGQRFQRVQRGQSMLISDWGTYRKFWTYKYQEGITGRVKGNGHRFGNKSIETKIEQGGCDAK